MARAIGTKQALLVILVIGMLQVSHGAIQFMVYEELKAFTAGGPRHGAGQGRQLSSLEISLIGALSKLAASVTTYPSQVGTTLCPDP